jgi:hypothetical protein
LIAFSPYRNGSHLVSTVEASSEQYVLYCSCGRPPATSLWNCSKVKTYVVSRPAYERGYGNSEEIVLPGSKAGNDESFKTAGVR